MNHPPRTPLSFVFHTTSVSAYRRESHEDLRTSFARFNINDANMRLACIGIENASYDLRVSSGNPHGQAPTPQAGSIQGDPTAYAKAQQDLQFWTGRLFALLRDDFEHFLTNPQESRRALGKCHVERVTPDLWRRGDGLFLDLIYFSFYLKGFATQVINDQPLCAELAVRWSQLAPGSDFSRTLEFIRKAGEHPGPQDPTSAREQAEVLCRVLDCEYRARGWLNGW